MTERALIIAIEDYDQATDGFTANKLTGTLEAAKRFRSWLEEKWQAERLDGSILFCSEPPLLGNLGAGVKDIVEALIKLQTDGRNKTDNLYVYFSGHGFRLAGETLKLADVLVAADFKDVRRSGASCFKLDALIQGLRSSLGPGCHFYFIDACRNEITNAIGSDITPFGKQGNGEPSVFVLQSTVADAPALVGGPFAEKLLEGLRGAGKAKVWEPPITSSMKVRFDSLRKFLKDALQNTQPVTQSTNGEKGESEAVLATIQPVPPKKLTITLKTVLPGVKGEVTVTPYGTAASTKHKINAPTLVLDLPPNYYKTAVSIKQATVSPAGEVEVELYENRELVFDVGPGGPAPVRRSPIFPTPTPSRRRARPLSLGNVHVEVPAGTEVVMGHVATGLEKVFRSSERVYLPMGTYATTLRTLSKIGGAKKQSYSIIRRREISVKARAKTVVAPASWAGSLPHESIARMFPKQNGGVDFSEALGGAVTDPDLSVWLAIIGAGRILGPKGDFSKIGPLPLNDFSSEKPGACPVYVLAGLPDSQLNLRLTLDSGKGQNEWLKTREPSGMKGLREAVLHPRAGQCFITLAIGGQPAYTLTSFASPNRCTLIVLTLDEGEPRVGQYLLPLGHLVQNLNPIVQRLLNSRNQLKDVQTLALLSRAFRKRRKLEEEFKDHELNKLLYAKWLDPIGASLATYECVRRNKRNSLWTVARNMTNFFPDLPDTAAISRIAGNLKTHPNGVPLFLDGLRAFPDYAKWLPYPAGLLDFSGPWTAWRGAVQVPKSGPRAASNPKRKSTVRSPRKKKRG